MKLTNLVTLDLRGNHFKEITNEISKLKSLRELIIADNQYVYLYINAILFII